MSKYYLLKWDGNWADEMDVDGMMIMSEEDKKEFDDNIKKLKKYFKNGECDVLSVCVGTNEEIEYEDMKKIKDSYSIKEITEDERNVLVKLKVEELGFACTFVEAISEWIEDYEYGCD